MRRLLKNDLITVINNMANIKVLICVLHVSRTGMYPWQQREHDITMIEYS